MILLLNVDEIKYSIHECMSANHEMKTEQWKGWLNVSTISFCLFIHYCFMNELPVNEKKTNKSPS